MTTPPNHLHVNSTQKAVPLRSLYSSCAMDYLLKRSKMPSDVCCYRAERKLFSVKKSNSHGAWGLDTGQSWTWFSAEISLDLIIRGRFIWNLWTIHRGEEGTRDLTPREMWGMADQIRMHQHLWSEQPAASWGHLQALTRSPGPEQWPGCRSCAHSFLGGAVSILLPAFHS